MYDVSFMKWMVTARSWKNEWNDFVDGIIAKGLREGRDINGRLPEGIVFLMVVDQEGPVDVPEHALGGVEGIFVLDGDGMHPAH